MHIHSSLLLLIYLSAFNTYAAANNATISGDVTLPSPTITNIAIEWAISGDDNLDGVVAVKYRKTGASDWNNAMPLRRIPAGENEGFSWKNRHSGSIFDLRPGTTYEIALSLSDPDGGSAQKTVTAMTRPVPAIPSGAIITELPSGTHDIFEVQSGTEIAPRVYRSNNGSAVYDFVNLSDMKWVYIIGVTFKSSGENSARAIRADGAQNCVIRYCTITGLYGITASEEEMTNCYIADNTITGKCGWTNETMGADGDNEGEGIQFTGSGNVICHNKITGFRDCISFMEDDGASNQYCNDIYNNDLFTGADDAIEADFCFHNCRVMRNRITNCYVGLSSQPGLGGPTYFIRNVMYNVVHAAFKLKRFSQGDVVLHNTVIKVGAGLAGNDEMDYAYFRNNCAFGGPDGGVEWGGYGAGNPYAADIRDPGTHSSFDYDAVGVYDTKYIAKIGGEPFNQVESHGIADIKLSEVFPGIQFPNPPVPERTVVDLRPASGSSVIDKGVAIPNVNDNFAGAAPDCGAYETGQALAIYGPRPKGIDEASSVRQAAHMQHTSTTSFSYSMTNGKLKIHFSGTKEKIEKVILYNASGKLVSIHNCNNINRIDGSSKIIMKRLPAGVYFIQLFDGIKSYYGSLSIMN